MTRDMDDPDFYTDADTDEYAPKVHFYTVAIYLREQAYGGPEEGGWWYDTGTRIDDPAEHGCDAVPRIFVPDDLEIAREFCATIQSRLDAGVNADRREYTSVLSTGRYYAEVCDGYPEPGYPAHRPHYE